MVDQILGLKGAPMMMRKAGRHRHLSQVSRLVKMRRGEAVVHHPDKRNCQERAALERMMEMLAQYLLVEARLNETTTSFAWPSMKNSCHVQSRI